MDGRKEKKVSNERKGKKGIRKEKEGRGRKRKGRKEKQEKEKKEKEV